MSCQDCKLRKEIAIAFDLHWTGADDCPMDCPEKKDNEK